jgi:1-acyl-sn-glycerol-3-phosphate acyltransferase
MMPTIRRFYRLIALFFWFAYTYSLAFPNYFTGWKGVKKVTRVTRLWAYGIARILNLRVNVHGDADQLTGGLIISNHVGYLDIITHASVFPVRFTPKADIAKWPILGQYLTSSRPIWIDRTSRQASRHVKQEVHDTLERGIPLIIYPEGTSSDGKQLLPFKSTPFESAINGGFPIFPILTRYKSRPDQDTVCWYGDMTLLPHVWSLLGYSRVDADIHILEPISPDGKNRKEIAEEAHKIMSKAYANICKEEAV